MLPDNKIISCDQLSWYAILSRSRHEKIVAGAMRHLGVKAFLPLVPEMHHWSDRRKVVDVPLFPGYVFVQIPPSPEAQLRVLRTAGVVMIVGNRCGPSPIRDKEIDDVRLVLAQKKSCSPYPFLEVGQRVRIVGGALDGVEGALLRRGSESKLVVSIELIQRSVVVSLYNFEVASVSSSRGTEAYSN
jgi:transcriptional antiterminator NusG